DRRATSGGARRGHRRQSPAARPSRRVGRRQAPLDRGPGRRQLLGADPVRVRLDGRAEKEMTLAAGTKLGPYEILAPIGAGGMGEVYRAKDTRLGRDVAGKVLPTHLSTSEEIRQRLERDAKTNSQFS